MSHSHKDEQSHFGGPGGPAQVTDRLQLLKTKYPKTSEEEEQSEAPNRLESEFEQNSSFS